MPRPLISTKPVLETKTRLDVHSTVSVRSRLTGPELERRIKQRRPKSYIDLLCKLDAGTHLHDPSAVDALVASVKEHFGDLAIEQRPLGYVQKCILGPEYEVHILDLKGASVVAHYKLGDRMPDPFEGARKLALHPSRALLNTYAFVEVFADRLVAVYADGPVTSVDPSSL